MYSGNYFIQIGQQVPFAPYWRSFQNDGQKAPEVTKGFPYTIYVGDNPPPYAVVPLESIMNPYKFYDPYHSARSPVYPGERINMMDPNDVPPGWVLVEWN